MTNQTTDTTKPIDYEAEFKHLENEVKVLKESFTNVVTEAQALCDNVGRFKLAIERVEVIEAAAQGEGHMAALIEARALKNNLWDAIMNGAEEVSLRISQLPPGATFIDPKPDTAPALEPATEPARRMRP